MSIYFSRRIGGVSCATVLALLFSSASFSQENVKRKGGKANAKDSSTWSAEEYSGLRGKKETQAAIASKGFTWITGSPADNETLSIGKNAQFFGFVALRYQSGRAAKRGVLGRAMYAIASEPQRELMANAVRNELAPLDAWWQVREQILTQLEDHLYTGIPINQAALMALGERFATLNSDVSIHEARAYAAFEDRLSAEQQSLIQQWRADPQTARATVRGVRIQDSRVQRDDWKLLEDLYAKGFSWLSGTREDNEIIPIGQPAQFFGFVSIRHKSGHGANRGRIAEAFTAILNGPQRAILTQAVNQQLPVVRQFLQARHRYLNQLALLRSQPSEFNPATATAIAKEMGRLEMKVALIEAQAYRIIRASMTDTQVKAAMKLRGHYVLDDSQVASLSLAERGKTLAVLCSGCHGQPNAWRAGMIGPSLDGFWQRPMASAVGLHFHTA